MKEKADKLFEKQEYIAATPVYLQLLSLQPRNPQYNYRYGTCLLFNSKKKQDAIKYLEFATASASIELEAFFFMGKAYHLNYQFEEAIKFYQLYKTNSRGKPNKALEVERQIEMCENGKTLLKNLVDIVVLEKKEYRAVDFYALYDFTDVGGNISVSASSQSKVDKKKGFVPVIHYPADAQQVFFASYGDDETNGKQIYVKRKLKEGGWSVPEPVRGEVNTKFNEDFPYMHPNGEYLYFSSEGHNSMGGYDVFRSKYNPSTNSFEKPENVDFAISSADDDLFYVVDASDKNAWFASARQSQDGKITVYKVKVDRLPSSIVAIHGTFNSAVHPENKKFNIVVRDLSSGKEVGTFFSKNDGSYLITLSKGGKYEYATKILGTPEVFKTVVNVPVLGEFKILKQKILHEETAGKETIKVIDQFDETVENADAILAEIVKMRSELDPNASQFDLTSLEKTSGSKEVFADLGYSRMSPSEVKDKVKELVKSQSEQVKTLQELQQKSLALVVANAAEIKTLQNDFKNKVNETNKENDPAEKYKIYQEAEKIAGQITALEAANRKLIQYADSLSKPLQSEAAEATKAGKLTELLQGASDDAKLIQTIADNKEQIKALQGEAGLLPSEVMVKENLKLKEELKTLQTSRDSYQATANGLKNEISALETKITSAKAKDKPAIQTSVDAKKSELELMEQQTKVLDKRVEKKAEEVRLKEAQLEYLQEVQKETLPTKSITAAEGKKTIETTDNQNYKTLKSYVSQQKSELEKKNPALASSPENVTSPEVVKPENVLERISPKYEERLSEIENNSEYTAEERLQLLQKEDENLKKQIAEEKQRTENKIRQNPSDPKAKEELKALQEIEKQVDNRVDQRTEAIKELNTSTSPESKVTAETIIKEIKPDLDKRMSEIANNPNLSATEQLKMAQNEELEFEQLVSDQIEVLQKQLEQNPSDKTAQSQLKTLQTLKKEAADRIDNRSLAISSLDPSNTIAVEKPTKPEVLASLKSDHTTKTDAINANPDLNPRQKLQELQKEDEILLRSTNETIQRVEQTLKQNPNDSKAQAQYEWMLEIRNDVEERLAERKSALDQPEIATPEFTSPAENVVARIKPDHQQKTEAIANNDLLSPQERQTKLIQEEAKLQKAIEAEIKKTDKSLSQNPSDARLMAEKEQLQALKEQSETRSDESRQALIAEEKTQIKSADLLIRTDKNYQLDIQKIENSDAPDEVTQLAAREQASQQILQAQIDKNNASLAKKDNLKLAAENQVLNELIDASQKRLESLGEQKDPVKQSDPLVENKQSIVAVDIKAVRTESMGEAAKALTDNPTSLEGLKAQQQVLEDYQSHLSELIEENEAGLALKPNDKQLQANHAKYLEEQKTVEAKQKQVNEKLVSTEKELATQTVKDPVKTIEPEVVSVNKTQTAFADHPDIRELVREEQELRQKLTNPSLSAKEKEGVSKEIALNQTKQTKVENTLMEERIQERSAAVQATTQAAQNSVSADPESKQKELATIESISKSEANLTAQLKEAKSQKDPEARQELLNQISSKQRANEEKLEQVKIDQALNKTLEKAQEIHPEMDVYGLQSTKDLEVKRRKGRIDFGELTSEVEKLEEEMKSSSRSAAKLLAEEKKAKETELRFLQAEINHIEAELEKRKEQPVAVYKETAIQQEITYQEEQEIASSEVYKDYHRKATEAISLQQSITAKNDRLETLKSENNLLISKAIATGSEDNQGKVEENVLKIASLTKELEAEKIQYAEKQKDAQNSIKDSGNEMKIQNLIARGVDPVSKLVVATTLVALPAKGFEIVPDPVAAPVKIAIPVGVDVPSGLVYRVQVGAFAKPIKEELFKEFNPVSGEKMNSGITRYMAGYFNNRASVLDARQQIIALGYTDAFPVAYCDGQRISMQEARRLEESGQCVGLGVDDLVMEASKKVSEIVPADTSRRSVVSTDPGAYNKAPGAAKALAVESRPGLFFTVQVGVYNKPVATSQVKNMEPLITKRLANGQIRYSAGIFRSVESAQPKRQEAIARGIKDAFITAYYKGERISLEEARKLLQELGDNILEKENPRENKIAAPEKIRQMESETAKKAFEEELKASESGFSEKQIQFISKTTYETFPNDLLKRLNENGSFYYDESDKRVKSIVYKNEDYVPQVYNFRNEIDTVFREKGDSIHLPETFEIRATTENITFSGEAGNWLLRLGYLREVKYVETSDKKLQVQLRIFGIREEAKMNEVADQLKSFGFMILESVKVESTPPK